jgi:acetoacetate decarboxylase
MPWHLVTHGATLISLHWLATERARAWVPAQIGILPMLPRRTIGGLFLAEYGPGSDLQYNELIAACATVWHARRPCAWVTHLFVDSHASVNGGRTLLGAPKSYAPFRRESFSGGGRRITIGTPERPICTVQVAAKQWLLPWRPRLRVIALHRDARDPLRAVVHGNQLRGRLGIARARLEIPEQSPLYSLGFGRPLLTLCARDVEAVLGGAGFRPIETVRLVGPPAAAELSRGASALSPPP